MRGRDKYFLWIYVFGATIILTTLTGCQSQKQEGDEPTKYVSQEGLERLTQQAAQKSSGSLPNIKDNPGFASSHEVKPDSTAVKNIDALLRPVLVQQFGAAKMTAQVNESSVPREGDVLLNSMQYVVRQTLNEANVRALHTALKNAHFNPNVRLGTKPTVTKSWAMMSFYKTTPAQTYSLELKIDFKTQVIKVESYKLNSKYDRLL